MTTDDTTYYTELEDLIASGNFWASVSSKEEQDILQALLHTDFSTKHTEKKAISLKMPVSILSRLKAIGERDAIPYQTLLISIAKKYTEGRLVERD